MPGERHEDGIGIAPGAVHQVFCQLGRVACQRGKGNAVAGYQTGKYFRRGERYAMSCVLKAFSQGDIRLDVAAGAVSEDGEVDGVFLIVPHSGIYGDKY
jgi:hypothetical protein